MAGKIDATDLKKPSLKKAIKKFGPSNVKIARLMDADSGFSNYPYALPTLLKRLDEVSTIKLDQTPVIIHSFEDPALFKFPFIYVNFADRQDWTFSNHERQNIEAYLERGGFIFVDAGITAEFLRDDLRHGQHHSFAEWNAHPKLATAFKTVFPGQKFRPLKHKHALFKSFYKGLPDSQSLPDSVRKFVIKEKWPEGYYSAVGLTINGRLAVLATPIIAMGWGEDALGNWRTSIHFRIRESAPGLSQRLSTASYGGERFEVTREDGLKDIIYCQDPTKPAWVKENNGQWRVFKYYNSREINDFAHQYFTRLGINIIIYALTH